MNNMTIERKLGLLLGIVLASGGACWLLSLPQRPSEILPRLGFVSALACATAVLVCCWSASVAYICRKRNLTPRACYLAGLSILAVLIPMGYFAEAGPSQLAVYWMCPLLVITGYLCRKLAYPELTDEEATAPVPPPSLFPK